MHPQKGRRRYDYIRKRCHLAQSTFTTLEIPSREWPTAGPERLLVIGVTSSPELDGTVRRLAASIPGKYLTKQA